MGKKYQIEIEETMQKVVKIKANSLDEAMDIVQNRYSNGEYVLDYEDYKGVEFKEYKDEKVKAIVHNVESLSPEKQELFKNLLKQMSDEANRVEDITSKDKELMSDFLFRAMKRDDEKSKESFKTENTNVNEEEEEIEI